MFLLAGIGSQNKCFYSIDSDMFKKKIEKMLQFSQFPHQHCNARILSSALVRNKRLDFWSEVVWKKRMRQAAPLQQEPN